MRKFCRICYAFVAKKIKKLKIEIATGECEWTRKSIYRIEVSSEAEPKRKWNVESKTLTALTNDKNETRKITRMFCFNHTHTPHNIQCGSFVWSNPCLVRRNNENMENSKETENLCMKSLIHFPWVVRCMVRACIQVYLYIKCIFICICVSCVNEFCGI